MKNSIYIEAPVETVFDFVKEGKDAHLTPIDTEILDMKVTKEGVGTYMNWRIKVVGIPVEGLDVVTDLVPNKRITSKSSRAMVGTWDYTFEPEGTGTRLTMEHRSRSFWQLPLLRSVMDMGTSRMNASYTAKLKAAIEAEARKPKPVPQQRKAAAGRPRKAPTAT